MFRNRQLLISPAFGAGTKWDITRSAVGHQQVLPSANVGSAQTITPCFDFNCHLSSVARRQQLLSYDVGRDLRSADAESFHVEVTYRGIWTKGQLNRLLEIGVKVDVTSAAVDAFAKLDQRILRIAAATHWADQVPLQIEESGARRFKTKL